MNKILICSFLAVFFLISMTSCKVQKYEDVSYLKNDPSAENGKPTLNLFIPKKPNKEKLPVLIFVHGGNWNSGNKDLYNFFGNNFARKDVVTVIPGYTLSPEANYETMTQQIAQAILWVHSNISKYNGDPAKIFITGHSAGAHLVTLAVVDNSYGVDPETIRGIIFNDAAGLDMHHYLEQNNPTTSNDYLSTWGKDPNDWKKASPIYFLDEETPPIKIYLGKKTYSSITTGNDRFLSELKKYQPNVEFNMLNKKHIPMMTQYLWPWTKRYQETINFMESITQ